MSLHRLMSWGIPLWLCVLCCCGRERPDPLTAAQEVMRARIAGALTFERLLSGVDTVTLTLPPGLVMDVAPKVRFCSEGFVLFNEMGKNVVIVSPRGRFLRSFGRAGAGPGEFRSMVSVAVDAHDSIYVFDNLLARLSVFSPEGRCVRMLRVANPFLIRHMCVNSGGMVFLHHAPDSLFPGYVSVYDRHGFSRCLVQGDRRYGGYFERGHLDGNLIATRGGLVYETNTFSCQIQKITAGFTVTPLGGPFAGYTPPPSEASFPTIDQLQRALAGATVIHSLQLVHHESLLLQEVISFRPRSLGAERSVNLYDTSGTLLGQLPCAAISLDASDGHRLLSVDLPLPSLRDTEGEVRQPRLILYELKDL